MPLFLRLIPLVLVLWTIADAAQAERVKDLASIAGVRSNQLLGYGLVVGLDGTGDQTSQTPFTVQSFRNMLASLGVTLPPGLSIQLKNVAAVAISADLPPFAKPGQSIDVTVSSLGNAKSLRGGTLLMSPLKGADGQIYGIAQGNVVVGGLGVEGEASRVSINVPSVGRIPNGATVERAVANPFGDGDALVLNLKTPDFTTAQRVADVVNTTFGAGVARAMDGASIRVLAPRDVSQRVGFVAALEGLEVEPGTAPARVIVNSRTGTVVIGQNVKVLPAAVAHGSLTVSIAEQPLVSQPNALAGGDTVAVPRTEIQVREDKAPAFMFGPGVTLQEIVNAINKVGASPSDLVAILEALRSVGALRAELIVI